MFAKPPRPFSVPKHRLYRWVLALGSVGVACAARLAIEPLVGNHLQYVVFVAAIVVATWIAGKDGGLLSVVASALAGHYLFVEPRFRFDFTPNDTAAILVFAAVGIGLVWLVSSWRDAQLHVRDLHQEIFSVLEQLPVGVLTADSRGNLVFANREIERVFGQRFLPTHLTSFRREYQPFHADGSPLTQEESPLLAAVKGQAAPGEDIDVVRADGTRVQARISATPIRRDDGSIVGGAVVVVDVTESKRMEARVREQAAELERANRVKDEFLATLGHELRTPLNAIVGWAGMLLRGGLSEDVTRRAHEAIARNADAQRALIEDVLDVSRIVSGKIRLDAHQVDVEVPVRNVLDTIRPLAAEKKILVTTDFGQGPASVWGDSSRLQQVFLNLLSNAVKFTESGGSVHVSIRRTEGEVEVRVADTGIGIAAEMVPHVFERFRQADSSSTRSHTGLGLGLAIVRHLVGLHGGTVEAQSEGIGHGAVFIVRLPYRPMQDRRNAESAAHPRHAAAIVPATPPAPSLCGVRVMVVDDEADSRELARSVLAMSGASVWTAASATNALELLETETPDVMLVDIAMPTMDGYALVQSVRGGRSRSARVPAIAFTAYAREEDRWLSLTNGFQMHLAKPVDPCTLIRAIASVLENERASGETD